MSLRPATLQAMAAFQKRRTRLLLMRGGLFAAAVLLALFLVIALLDRVTFMPDALRKTLSYGAWLAAIIATLVQTGRLLLQHRDTAATARLMEKADPALRERLLAAIELSNDHQGNDSAEFRGHLQDQVATQLAGFNAETILPTRLLTRSMQIVAGVVVLIILLSFFSGLHLPGFIARAALPFANIGRPSSVKIRVLSPEKARTLAPFSSQTHLAIQIEGPTPQRVIVEQQSEDSAPTRQEMTRVGGDRFESTLYVEQQSVRYRILAADAITSWLTLDARPRPRAIEFIKVITPPAYSKLPAQTLTEDHGDLSALEGSTLQVRFKGNQELESADAQLLPGKTPLAISAEKETQTHKLELTLDGKADSWKLNLTAKETRFTNDETSPWRIDVIKDLPPGVTLVAPLTDEQIRADQVIQASGTANDDIGLAKVELSFAVNGTDWKQQEIPGASGLEAAVQTSLDLNKITLNAGDALLLKLAATDVKGQRSESNAVRLLVVNDQLDTEQRAWSATQKELATQAHALVTEMRNGRKQAEQVKDKAKKDKDDAENSAALANLQQQLESVQEQSDQLWQQIKQAAMQAPTALKQQEMNLVGQHLARLRDEHLPELKQQLAKVDETKELRRTASEATASAETLADSLRTFATADLAQSAHEAFQQLAPQQQQLADRAIDDNRNKEQRPRWQEKQKAALAAAKAARADLEALHEIAPDNRKRDIQNQLNNLDQKIPGTEGALDTPEQHQAPEFLYGQAHELRNASNQARDLSRWMSEEAQNKAAEMRDRLQQRDNAAFAALAEARDHLARAANGKKPEEQQKSANKSAEKLKAAAKQLTSQSELREQNAATNTLAALDQNRLGRALEELAGQIPDQPTEENSKALREQISGLMENARTLEADAMAQDAQQALEEGQSLIANKAAPQKQFQAAMAAQSQLRPMDKALQRAKADQPAIQAAQKAREQADRQSNEARNQTNNAINQKQNQQPFEQPQDQHNPTLDANKQAMEQLAAAREAFSPAVNTAREKLEAMTPKLSEMAQQAAQDLRKTQQTTEQMAQQAPNQPAEQTAAATQQDLLPQAAKNAQKLESLQAALRQETAHANMADEAQRQMARSADVGLAQMQQQTPQIAANLQQAKEEKDSAAQQQALQNAAQSQQQTADALEQMSRNLARMEQGQTLPQDALAAQRAVEEALGIKESLDESYNDLQNIQQLMEQAKNQPQETLTALEQELKKNPAMQKALGNLSSKEASDAKTAMNEVKAQPQMLQDAAPTEASDLARVARHQQRLDQKEAASKIAEAGKQLEQLGQSESSESNAQAAATAAEQASEAANAAAKTLPAPENPSLFQSVKGAMLAQALDQLDQAMNAQSNTDGQQQGDASQSQQQQQQQQSAQQSLANASQAQSQSMAQARAQGQVPGQQPQSGSAAQQMAQANQGQQQPASANSAQPSQDAKGNWSQTPTNLVVPVTTLVPGGDWGKLPARMAKDLNDAARQEPSPEYRDAIESYYKAIAEKARK